MDQAEISYWKTTSIYWQCRESTDAVAVTVVPLRSTRGCRRWTGHVAVVSVHILGHYSSLRQCGCTMTVSRYLGQVWGRVGCGECGEG